MRDADFCDLNLPCVVRCSRRSMWCLCVCDLVCTTFARSIRQVCHYVGGSARYPEKIRRYNKMDVPSWGASKCLKLYDEPMLELIKVQDDFGCMSYV